MKYKIFDKNEFKNLLLVFFVLSANCYSQNNFPASGNVGIGTLNPSRPFHLNQTINDAALLISAPNNLQSIELHLADNINGEYGFFSLGGGTKLRGNGQPSSFSGKLGIGVESPTEALEVNGNISLGIDKSSSTRDNTYGNKLFFLGANRNTDDLWIARYNVMSSPNSSEVRLNLGDDPGHYGDKFVVGVTKTGIWYPKFSVSGNGNVGIGTTTPDSKLSVNGTVHAKEVKVDLSNWSDFVFENSYSLPTLEEVENHIKKYGHLKDIPSSVDVEKNGIFLGEMDAKLLQKIEELTLYTIQQDNKLQKQDELIAILLNKIETFPNE